MAVDFNCGAVVVVIRRFVRANSINIKPLPLARAILKSNCLLPKLVKNSRVVRCEGYNYFVKRGKIKCQPAMKLSIKIVMKTSPWALSSAVAQILGGVSAF